MSIRDRTISLILVTSAFVAWVALGLVFTNISPVGSAGAQLLGALLLGTAVGLTGWPLLLSAVQRADRPSGTGDVITAGRRSLLIGLVVTILVVLRVLDAVAIPVLLFIIIAAVLVELAVTLRH